MKMQIGEVYKVLLDEDETRFFRFEICGEVFHDGRRFAIGVKQKAPPEDQMVLFDETGNGHSCFGEFSWRAYGRSQSKPVYQREYEPCTA